MYLPEGAAKYSPIMTQFVNVEKFLDSLYEDAFTGYCEFKIKGESTLLLYEKGKIQRVFRLENGMTTLLMQNAARAECETASETVRSVMLPSEIVDMMIRLLFCKPLHQDLSTKFIDPKNLLRNLEGERFTGYIEIGMEKDVHYLSLENGGPRSALYLSGNHLFRGAEAFTRIFDTMEMERALLNIYSLQEVPFAEVFLKISEDLLTAYKELKGPILTQQFWKKLSLYAENFGEIGMEDLEFHLEGLPKDLRRQEEILVSLLHCQVELLTDELGEKATQTLYYRSLEGVESPVREIFGGVIS